jgi:proline iminopeptidase
MPRTELYPAIEPYESGHLQVARPHSIYWEECGNPDGVPVLFLHGGPGAGFSPGHRRFFDPAFYRIVLVDQRGAGRSVPYADIQGNDTQSLIADLETLRDFLEVDQWLLFGGSWGSSLALAYAEAHPASCAGLILRGIFLCRKQEVDWFMTGMRQFFPAAWDDFMAHLTTAERADPLNAYYRRLCDPDPAVHMPAAEAWSRYEASCSTLIPSRSTIEAMSSPETSLALSRLEAHYFVNNLFLREGQLLEEATRLRGLPGIIVQGRYDVVCPPSSAWELSKAWPEAELIIVPDAGHSAAEDGTMRELVAATEKFKDRLPISKPARKSAPKTSNPARTG